MWTEVMQRKAIKLMVRIEHSVLKLIARHFVPLYFSAVKPVHCIVSFSVPFFRSVPLSRSNLFHFISISFHSTLL